ncbi:unnamed protein product [Rhodiola kirilowii]
MGYGILGCNVQTKEAVQIVSSTPTEWTRLNVRA